nr:hypothetical protein K-LCC10_0364 [Kaumoebavirus]
MDLSNYETKFNNQKTYPVISEKEIVELVRKYGVGKLIKKLAGALRNRFPDKSFQLTREELANGIRDLSKWQANWLEKSFVIRNMPYYKEPLHFDDKPLLLETPSSQYRLDILPEYFTDVHRMGVRRYDAKQTPMNMWKNETKKFVGYCLKKYKRIDPVSLRESVYALGQEATEFKVTVAMAMIKKFNAKRLLDISAGRGVRLFAALVSQLEYYTACDPDLGLIPIHNSIVEAVKESKLDRVGSAHTKVQICYQPFEDMELEALECREYDLVFTSPPYFNLEIYSEAETQSVSRYSEVDSWLNGFLFPAIRKAWSLLVSGGTMAININDINDGPKYVMPMIEEAGKLPGSTFRGVIGYGDPKRGDAAQPVWCWTKK